MIVGVGVCVAKIYFSIIAHVSGELEIEELCDLCVRSLWSFLEVVRQYV